MLKKTTKTKKAVKKTTAKKPARKEKLYIVNAKGVVRGEIK